jgi:hypothetical protein
MPGSGTELENLSAVLREKAQRKPREAESTDPLGRAHCLVVVQKWGNPHGAKGTGHPCRVGVNGQPEELLSLTEGGSLRWMARAG